MSTLTGRSRGRAGAPARVAVSRRAARSTAGLITRGREATRRPCRLEAAPLAEATAWMESYRKYWERNFGALDRLLEEMKSQPDNRKS